MTYCHYVVNLVLVDLKKMVLLISLDQKTMTSSIILVIGPSLGTMTHNDMETNGFKNNAL